MERIKLEKSQIESAIVNINKYVSILSDQLNSICNRVDMVKSVWSDDIGLFDHVTSLLNLIRGISRDYKSFCDDFTNALQDMVLNYETVDKDITTKFSSGDVVGMTLGAMAFKNFDFSKTADKASNLTNGKFLNEKSIYREAFCDGEYKLNYLDNDVVRIDKNGQTSLNELHPDAERMKNQLIEECAKQGLHIKVTESVRSASRQDQLYAQGRTTSGKKVTNAKGSSYSSNHQWGIALMFVWQMVIHTMLKS